MKTFFSDKRLLTGFFLLVAVSLFSFLGPLCTSYGEYEILYLQNGTELRGSSSLTQPGVTINMLAPPSASHLLGTDREGRDLLVRLMYGGRVSLSIGLLAILVQALLGALLGGIAGYFGGLTDYVVMRLIDLTDCMPDFPIILVLSAVAAKGGISPKHRIYLLILVIAFFGAMRLARVVRGQVLFVREQDYILAAEAMGIGAVRKITAHILPNVLPQIIAMSVVGVGGIILTESALSFLGFGLPYPYASWGNMITSVQELSVLSRNTTLWVPPGLMIFTTVLSFHLVGGALEEGFHPKEVRSV